VDTSCPSVVNHVVYYLLLFASDALDSTVKISPDMCIFLGGVTIAQSYEKLLWAATHHLELEADALASVWWSFREKASFSAPLMPRMSSILGRYVSKVTGIKRVVVFRPPDSGGSNAVLWGLNTWAHIAASA